MIAELLSLAYDAAGLIPGAAEAEKLIALGEDAYNAYEAVTAFLATPTGQALEGDLGGLFTNTAISGASVATSSILIAPIIVNPVDRSGRRGSLG